jgi:hypothetical protein
VSASHGIHFAMAQYACGRSSAALYSIARKETTNMSWKGLAGAALTAVLACGSAALAANANQDSVANAVAMVTPNYLDDATTAPAPAPAASAPSQTTLTPLMFLLDPTPVGQWLEKNKINITGFVEVGTFYNASAPGVPNTFATFPGFYPNRFLLDQVDLTISKSLDTTKSWDWGFLFENGYGIDDSFIHSHGMLDNRPPGNPNNQYDIIQANLQLLVPIGSGVTITAGKFIAYIGQEVINPTGNTFYTHSVMFFYGMPATNTGVMASYTFAKLVNGNDLNISAGFTEGWNQSLRDNNSAIDFLGQAKSSITDKLSMVFNLEVGPQAAHDESNYWTTVELIPTYAISDQLTVVADCLYSTFPHGATTIPGATAQWYGVAGYAIYKINSYVSASLRAEWYRDQGGFTTGTQANYYEATVGPQIHPLPNDNIGQWLQIRPEFRVDWSDRPVYDPAHNGGAGDFSQLSFAVDAIMQF